jgi:membrane-associated protease RseP (regulator of RpoE activity)
MRTTLSYAAAVAVMFCLAATAAADTVILRDGTRVKGLILDEMKDRIVFSTPAGEVEILKSEIRSAIYDTETQALLQKGRNQIRRGQYIRAYYTFENVLEMDPEIDEARERLVYLASQVERINRQDFVGDPGQRNARLAGGKKKPAIETVRETIGLTFFSDGKYVTVRDTGGKGTPAFEAGLMPGDRIVSVWGNMAAYMDEDGVAESLLDAPEVKMTVERTVTLVLPPSGKERTWPPVPAYRRATGAAIFLKKKGFVAGDVSPGGAFGEAGIKEGDLLYRIAGKNTRYMPFRAVRSTIEAGRGGGMEVVIRRDISLWVKEEER